MEMYFCWYQYSDRLKSQPPARGTGSSVSMLLSWLAEQIEPTDKVARVFRPFGKSKQTESKERKGVHIGLYRLQR